MTNKNTGTVCRKNTLSAIFRKIARPPVFAVAFLCVLYASDPAIFGAAWQLAFGIFALGVLPILGYPLQKYIPHFKDKGREGQRSLAMLFCFGGYLLGTVFALVTSAPAELLMVYLCYLSCGIGMLVFNKLLHLKASGHACGIMGPVFAMLLYFDLLIPALIGGVLALGVFASSVATKEHTGKQLLGGSMIAFVCIFVLSVVFR